MRNTKLIISQNFRKNTKTKIFAATLSPLHPEKKFLLYGAKFRYFSTTILQHLLQYMHFFHLLPFSEIKYTIYSIFFVYSSLALICIIKCVTLLTSGKAHIGCCTGLHRYILLCKVIFCWPKTNSATFLLLFIKFGQCIPLPGNSVTHRPPHEV